MHQNPSSYKSAVYINSFSLQMKFKAIAQSSLWVAEGDSTHYFYPPLTADNILAS